jgi:predicted nucleotidyltransferase
VLENDEHVDVLVARSVTTVDGQLVEFDSIWARRQAIALDEVNVYVPSLEDLILTKQVAARAKDLEDIRLLRILKEERR